MSTREEELRGVIYDLTQQVQDRDAEIERLRKVLDAAKQVLRADALPIPEGRAQFDAAMIWLDIAVEDAAQPKKGDAG